LKERSPIPEHFLPILIVIHQETLFIIKLPFKLAGKYLFF